MRQGPSRLRRVTIGPIELDPDGGEICKNGVRSYLPEQPLSILQALIDARGGVVSREELRHRLWPNDTFVDFEHGVNAAVKRLREALGDSADSPQFIETIPRRGYRLIAPIDQGVPPNQRSPSPFTVAHFHGGRLSMMNVRLAILGFAVAKDQLVFNLGEVTGNIWSAHTPHRSSADPAKP